MKYGFFTISATNPSDSEEELNKFLASHKILTIHREFVINGANSFWAIAVEYIANTVGKNQQSSKKKKVDYREILPAEDFALFSKLRDWRKDIANRDAVPVYMVFTNEQLAQIACNRVTTMAGLREIEGVGKARVDKYASVLDTLKVLLHNKDAA